MKAAFWSLALVTALYTAGAQTPLNNGSGDERLELRRAVKRDLGSGQTDVFTIQVAGGQFAQIIARQMGIDVALTVTDPAGKLLVRANSNNGPHGPETASVIAERTGAYQVKVERSANSMGGGSYEIEFADLRTATDRDRTRIRAEGVYYQAVALQGLREAKDLRRALGLYEEAAALWHSLGDRYVEALCLQGMGRISSDLGEKQKALDYYSQTLPLWRAAGDRLEEAAALASMGRLYSALGEKQKALEYHGQALPILRAISNRSGEASTLTNIGALYSALGEKRKALEYYGQALPAWRAAGDRSGEATTLTAIGEEYAQLGEKHKALEYFAHALPIWRAAGNRLREAAALNGIGVVYYELGETRKALEYYDQALTIQQEARDLPGLATTWHNIGLLSSTLGENQKALDFYGKALMLRRALGDRFGEATTLNNIGRVYDVLGEEQKALDYYRQTLPIRRAVGDRSGEAVTLNNMGRVYSDLGEKQKALDYYDQALTIQQAVGDRSAEAATMNNIGKVYDDLAEKQKALDYFGQALTVARAVGERSGEATTLNNIGTVYYELGERQKAVDYFRQALPIWRAVGRRSGEASTLSNIGELYLELGERQNALAHFDLALTIFRATGDRSGEATILNNLGKMYDDLGEKQKALDYYGQALTIQRAVGNRSREGATLSHIGGVYYELGERQKALDYYGQALPLLRAVGNRLAEAVSLHNLSFVFRKSSPGLAVLFGKQAVNVLQTVRRDNRGLDDALRRSFEKSIERDYRDLANLLIERQRFGEAEEVLNLLKDKEAADFIRRDAVADQLRPATLLDFEKKALERYEQILGRIVGFGQQKSALVAKAARESLSPSEREQADQLDRDLAAGNTVLLRFLAEQEKSFAADSAAVKRAAEFREAEGIQDALQALGPDVAAIYTLVTQDKYIALLITSGARKAYTTAIREAELNRKIFDFRQRLQDPRSDPLPLAQELYRIVFPEGLRQDLESMKARTIMWSIDSTLRYVPMAALHDGKEYLVSRFRNSMITPASLTRLTGPAQPEWKGVGFGVSEAKGGFSALPAVPDELRRIFRQTDIGDAPVPGRVRLDPEFTREAFQDALRQPDKSVVHVATHFDSRPGVAANSRLLLGDGTKLSLAEIEASPRLFSGVDLLTLSACSTAFTNRNEDGREVDSFGTIAQRLGARAVIASLWSVNDSATARLMETMYRLRQQSPALGKSESLRRAQEQMVSGALTDAWSHPFYWAPFILIGNWK